MDVSRTYLNPPAVAALTGMNRKSVWRYFDAGRFGPIIEHRGITYAAQPEIERAEGRSFTEQEIATAAAGLPHRVLILEQQDLLP